VYRLWSLLGEFPPCGVAFGTALAAVVFGAERSERFESVVVGHGIAVVDFGCLVGAALPMVTPCASVSIEVKACCSDVVPVGW